MAKFPKTIGECIDAAFRLRAMRLEIEKEADVLKTQQKELEDHILQSFSKASIDGAKGRVATAAVTRSVVPDVKDWDALLAHIKKTGELDLIQRRVSTEAARARWDEGVVVPGVEQYTRVGVSLTKTGSK